MPENFEERLPYLVDRVSTALTGQVDRALSEFALTHTQLGALAQLGLVAPGALSGATMGQRIGVTAQSMSTAITGLLARGLVGREPHPTHGRILEVRITPDGVALLDDAQAAIRRTEARVLAFLDADRQEELKRLLRTMMKAMDLYLYHPDAD